MIRVMPDSIAVIKAATPVLRAITDRVSPRPRDVEKLLKLAPECSHLSPDEIACEVAHRVLKERVTWGAAVQVRRGDSLGPFVRNYSCVANKSRQVGCDPRLSTPAGVGDYRRRCPGAPD